MSNLRPSVENLRDLGNFSQIFRFGVRIAKFPNLLSGYTSEEINFRCESHSLPEKTGETVTVTIRGNETRQPGKHAYNSPLTMTLVETNNYRVHQFIHDYGELTWQSENGSTGITQDKADLESTIELYLLDNKDVPRRKFILIGCFLETASKGDADASTSDPHKPQLSLAYDYFDEETI